jgi:DedD protein
MKMVIDERVKHRLIGLAVILSIAAIFAPAIMKKSNQRIDGNINVSLKLPAKPNQPDIEMVEEKVMFDSAKIAHVELPQQEEKLEQPLADLAKAESLSQARVEKQDVAEHIETLALADEEDRVQKPLVQAASNRSDTALVHKIAKAPSLAERPKPKPKVLAKTGPAKDAVKPISKWSNTRVKNGYAVQLATFSQQQNAEALISRLRLKGYRASYNKIRTRNGFVFKVLVGQMNKKEQAQVLQRQLATAVQIRGFVVTTGEG